MAIQSVQPFVLFDLWRGVNTGNSLPTLMASGTNWLLDAAGKVAAAVFIIPKSGNIVSFEWQPGTITTLDAGSALRQAICTVGADGTTLTEVTDAYIVESASAFTAATWHATGNFTSSLAVTRGNVRAVRIGFETFTTGDALYASAWPQATQQLNFPYCLTGATPTRRAEALAFVLKYDDGSYALPLGYNYAITSTTHATLSGNFSSSSSPDERGLRFRVPVGMSLAGVYVAAGVSALGNTFDVKLLDSGGSVLDTCSVNNYLYGDHATNTRLRFYHFTTSRTLEAATTYYLTILPTTTNTVAMTCFTAPSAAHLALMVGSQWWGVGRTDGGSFTDYTTALPLIFPVFDGIDAGAASSGGAGPTMFNLGIN